MNTIAKFALFFAILFCSNLFAGQLEEQLFEAARTGDIAKVKTLLDQGVDVNTKNRYGATALSYASDKGHIELARLLIERGADVNAADTFYSAPPITWALMNGHTEVVKLLLQKGANADDALLGSLEAENVDTVKLVLENSKPSAKALSDALEYATQQKNEALLKLLRDAGAVPHPVESEFKVEAESLKKFAGKFKNQEGNELVLTPQENGIHVQAQGDQFTLAATAENAFRIREAQGFNVEFQVQDGKSNQFTVKRPDGSTSVYTRMEETADQQAAASKPAKPVLPAVGKVTKPLNWPSFRGIGATGVADGQHPPITWDAEKGTNIAWKTPVPGLAHSSPVIWGDRIFITTAISSDPESKLKHGLYGDVAPALDLSKHSWRIYSINAKTGKIEWEKTVHEGAPNIKRHPKSTQANSTPATDGKHVVALFGFGGLYCFDINGNQVWKRDLGVLDSGWFYDPDYQWGFGSSPVIYKDLVIVQADLQKNSFIAAYNLKTGEPVWKTDRDEIPSWGSPTVVETANGAQVIANGTNFVRGYDVKTGKELWKLAGNAEITVPTPFVAHDLIYVTSGYRPIQPIYAIRLNAAGDISLKEGTETNDYIAWSKNRGGPYMPTPIVYGDYLYTCANNGVITAYNAKTGERVYQKRLGGQGSAYAFTASPVAADGRIYFPSEDGEVYVVKAGPEFEVLAINKINEVILASPAISNGMLVLRSLGHIYGIK